MDIYMLVLRLFHIGSGVFWAGAGIFFALYLEPSVAAAEEGGRRVMAALNERRLTVGISATAGVTMLSGILMYLRDTNGFTNSWISTGPGIMFTIGGVAGILSGVVGGAVVGRSTSRMAALGTAIAQAGGKPSPEQTAEMKALSERLSQFGKINAILLGIAVLCMGAAQYVSL